MSAPATESVRLTVLPGLDSLRAVGALAVVVTHVGFWSGSYGLDTPGTALARFDVGVAIFFVLSGYLLSRPFLVRARDGRAAPRLGTYYLNRALRVLPVFWVVAVVATLTLTENRGAGPGDWLRVLTLTELYQRDDRLSAGLTQMWSLATEVAFYVVLPLLMLGWTRARHVLPGPVLAGAAVVASAVVSVLWVVTSDGLAAVAPLHLQWLPAYLIWFVIGIALASLDIDPPAAGTTGAAAAGWLRRLGQQPGVCATAVLALFLMASTPLAGPSLLVPAEPWQVAFKTLVYAVIGGLLVLMTVHAPRGSLYQRAMAHPWGRHLGHISYGVFCVHLLVLHALAAHTAFEPFTGGFWLVLVVVVAVSVVLAEVLHRVVELPAQRLRHGRPSASVETPSSASGTIISS